MNNSQINSQLPIGMIIAGRYEVLGRLGGGAQGVVYRVRDQFLRETVALKLLSGVKSGEAWLEAAMLVKLTGEFLLPVKNADLASGAAFLVTEIAENGTAEDLIGETGINLALATRSALHAARALARMHDTRLVHNDIKPGNLFLDAQGNTLLGDLGLASKLDSSGVANFRGGTVSTMAPEVAAELGSHVYGSRPPNFRVCSVRSDVFGLGATLYWLLTGSPPYPGNNEEALPLAIEGAYQSLRQAAPHVPLSVVRVVEKAMSFLPADRYGSASEFDHALAHLKLPDRAWQRTNIHPQHVQCFTGIKKSSEILLCVEPEGAKTYRIISLHKSGRRAAKDRLIQRRALESSLRSVIRGFD